MRCGTIPTVFVPLVSVDGVPERGRWVLYSVACLHQVGLQSLVTTHGSLRPQRIQVYEAYSVPWPALWYVPLQAFLEIDAGWLQRNYPFPGKIVPLCVEWRGLCFQYPYGLAGGELTYHHRLRYEEKDGERIAWWTWW